MRTCNVTGKPLPPNLYNHQRNKPGHYRYKRSDGTMRGFAASYAEACREAERANGVRESTVGEHQQLQFWRDKYIARMESEKPSLKETARWIQTRNDFQRFVDEFGHLPVRKIKATLLLDWWDALSYDAQHNRRHAFAKWFQFMCVMEAATADPFTASNDGALPMKPKPTKKRMAMQMRAFVAISEKVPDWLRDAMQISLLTTMRLGDVITLRWDDVIDGHLHKTINKSENQRGEGSAAHLRWNLSQHTELGELIKRRRKELMKSGSRCPFIIWYAGGRQADGKEHRHQVYGNYVNKQMRKAGDWAAESAQRQAAELGTDEATAIAASLTPPPGMTRPTFHEIRGLGIMLLRAMGHSFDDIAEVAAHTDEHTTRVYVNNQAPEYFDVQLVSTLKP